MAVTRSSLSERKTICPNRRISQFLVPLHHPAKGLYKQPEETFEQPRENTVVGKQTRLLTFEEIHKLGHIPYIKESIHKIFLFACYCRLRVGDVSDLHWGDISVNDRRHFVSMVM